MRVKTSDNWPLFVNRWLSTKVPQHNAQSMYIPAGESPKPIYQAWRVALPDVVAGLRLYQVDEVEERFSRFFQEEIPNVTVYPPTLFAQADLAILGLGMNGHVAFHEPGVPHSFMFGDVLLKEDTATNLGLYAPVYARTYGLGAFLKTKAVLLLVRGEGKQHAFERFLNGDTALPATALQAHGDLTVITDLPDKSKGNVKKSPAAS